MNYKISFQERAKLGLEMLSKKSPVTLEQARAQAKKIEFSKPIKSKETAFIIQFCNLNDFWIIQININAFVSSGAEQKVYLYNKQKVIKLNV